MKHTYYAIVSILLFCSLWQTVHSRGHLVGTETRRLKNKYSRNLDKCKRNNCEKGYACNRDGNCQKCSKGTYAPYPELVDCYECPSGKFGTDAVDSLDACVDCMHGQYADKKRMAECKKCSPGFYQHLSGQTFCINALINDSKVLCNETMYLKSGSVNITDALRYYTDPHTCSSSKRGLKTWEYVLIVFGSIVLAIILAIVCGVIKDACYC